MANSIRLSPKHGVNPAIPLCFFCGEPKEEIVLMGKLPGDKEAPKHPLINGDYEPCDKCKARWAQGYALIAVEDHPVFDGQIPIREGLYPTSEHIVLTENGIRAMFQPEAAQQIIDKGRAYIDAAGIREIQSRFAAAAKQEEGSESTTRRLT